MQTIFCTPHADTIYNFRDTFMININLKSLILHIQICLSDHKIIFIRCPSHKINLKIILQVTIFGSGFEPSPGLIKKNDTEYLQLTFLWIKPAWCRFLGIYCTLVSSTRFRCQFHPSSGALVCTGGKVQYMCACSVSFGVEFQLLYLPACTYQCSWGWMELTSETCRAD